MRLRHKKGAEDEVLRSPYCINIDKTSDKLPLSEIFVNTNPLYLELGMGKGKFVCEMAKKYPDINFIGVEKYATVVLKAITNYKKFFGDIDPINLKFLCEGVENLDKYFKPHTIDKIFLNFSDPWPKKRHESRRLTHHNFLSLYEKLLKEDGSIEFKTDNVSLFDFSLEEIKLSHFILEYETHDLHNNAMLNRDNIMTEYESKFSARGQNICKYKIHL